MDYGIDIAKQKIDEAIANNGWVIFGMHCHYPNFDIKVVREIVNYARTKSVDIVSITEGLNTFGNIMEIGDSASLGKPNTFIIDSEGKTHGADSPHYVYRSGFTNSSVPSEFPINKTTITTIGTSNTAGFPNGTGGVLLTHLYSTETSFPWTYQEWFPVASNNKLTRYWDRVSSSWSSWKDVLPRFNITGTNTFSNSTLISSFPLGEITVTIINNNGSSGFPGNNPGTLTTYRLTDAWGRQEYKVYQSNTIYQRYINSSGVWSEWSEIPTVLPYRIDPFNTYNNGTLISAFPSKTVTTININSTGATGFPNSSPGLLTTYNINTGYGRQEYRVYRSHSIYARYELVDGTWSEWAKISAV